jgi:hypothetical protein
MLLALVMLAGAFLLTLFTFIGNFFTETYGSDLEKYIVSNNPQHTGDVERLTQEYNQRNSKKEWHL